MDSIRINTKDMGTVCGFRPAQLSRTNGHRPYRVKAVGMHPSDLVVAVSLAMLGVAGMVIGGCMVWSLVFPGDLVVM